MTRLAGRLLLLVAAACGMQAASPVTAVSTGQPDFVPCQVGGADAVQHLQAQCTSLSVPEDRAQADGKHILLHVAVLPARASEPAADPLFFIAGGPGEASSDAFVQEAAAFSRIRQQRDIVLVDQRGTGQSNRLDCPASPAAARVPSDSEIIRYTRACLKQLPGDPRFYTTSVAVQDLDAVRARLGYRTIDLYGISYGTRVALQYLREFPDHTRSVILDGVVPADLALGPQVSLDAQQALDRIFARCAASQVCHAAFPNLTQTFAALRRTLRDHPTKLVVRDPLTGAPLQRTLTWDDAASAIRLMSYQSETAALLPLLIHAAGVEHDYAPLLGNALLFNAELNNSLAQGMSNAVLCTEDAPFFKHDAASLQTSANTYLGGRTAHMLEESCSVWPRGVMAPDFKKPVISGKPVLLISGEDDPITPPANAAHAAKTLSNSLPIVVPGQGHGNAFRGCVPHLMAEFVRQASVKGLDVSCVARIKPFPFFVSFSGPAP